MFLDFYGFQEQPFGVTPDPRFLFWTDSHREALSSVYYGIRSGVGFVALIAPPGMGKSTLLLHLLERLQGVARTAFLFQTQCSSREFLGYLMEDLGMDAGREDTVTLHAKLRDVLIAEAAAGRQFVLVVDEAQNLDERVLETVRLLADFETPSRKLIQIVMAGQPDLAAKLTLPGLLQLRQRISIVARLQPLSPAEVRSYIEHRLRIAGRSRVSLFKSGALSLISSGSCGIPRRVNTLCFNALTLGYAQRRKKIDAKLVEEALSDLDIGDLVEPEDRAGKFSTPLPHYMHANRW